MAIIALFTAARANRRIEAFDTITVHRINVVDNDGTLRMLIANQENFPGSTLVRGKPLDPRARSVGSAASIFFYNRDGSEQGALRWDGQGHSAPSGHPYQYSSLTLDQLEGNDNLILSYGEQDGRGGAALSGFEQPVHTPIDTLLARFDTVGSSVADTARRRALRRAFQNTHFIGRERFYIGYSLTESTLRLDDAAGRPRLVLSVSNDGTPRIRFLDHSGAVVREVGLTTDLTEQPRKKLPYDRR